MEQDGIMKRVLRSGRAGMAMVLLGGCALGTGLVQTTSATYNEPPNKQCPTGTEFVARWDWAKGTGKDKDKYAWRLHSGDGLAQPTNKSARNSGPWTSTNTNIAALVIVSEPFSKIATYNPPVKTGAFDNIGLTKANGSKPSKWDNDLERLVFCSAIPPATTTTAKPTTTTSTTAKPTTTTSTTTTAAPTTTTSTTTTAAPTTTLPGDDGSTTTEPPVTTTTSTTTTTEPPTTTTSTTTTTEPPTTTTTTEPPSSTTTEPGDDGSTTTSTTTTEPGAVDGSTTTTAAAGATSTTTSPAGVLGTTSVYKNSDPAVAGAVTARPLAATGSTSAPLIVAGIVLILGGGAILTINRLREQQAQA
ncbi:MAG: hypothetical protein GX868_15230 [Actinobacteria bacterium]|nr:hypothetical protein [Actinomycetota bacterium]